MRKQLGLSQEECAVQLGFTRSYISQLESEARDKDGKLKEPGKQFIGALDRLENQHDAQKSYSTSILNEHSLITQEEPPECPALSIRNVPVISWAHAGDAATYEELPIDWQQTVPSTCKDKDAFGLEVEGDSMQPNYQPGTVLIVMPTREPRNGCLVVAKLKKNGVVFRRFNLIADNCIRLSAYNPIYPPYEGSNEDFWWIYPIHSTVKNEW